MISLQDIQEAQARIAPNIVRTPLLRMRGLDDFFDCRVYLKAESMQVTGAFKLRGALNKTLSFSREELDRGIVAVSSGNHGRAVAYAARRLAPGMQIYGAEPAALPCYSKSLAAGHPE